MSTQIIGAGKQLGASGSVYTRRWAVDFILNLAGYTSESNLVDSVAVEPAAGDGAFLVPMVERLTASCRLQERPLTDCTDSIIAYELNEASAREARLKAMETLIALGTPARQARDMAERWVRHADFLLAAGGTTPLLSNAGSAMHLPISGVDFVIGNPPYIRLEEIPAEQNSLYRTLYATMQGRADIYVAFFEAALRLLKPGGVCTYICADRWMRNQYGTELRRLITSGYNVRAVVEMHGAAPFEHDVCAYPAVTVIDRAPQDIAAVARVGASAERVSAAELARSIIAIRDGGGAATLPSAVRACRAETWFMGAEPWPCTSPERLALLKRLEREFFPLESLTTKTKVGIGVATGADKVYITQDPGVVEADRLLPIAVTDDITTGQLRWSGHYLINPWDQSGIVKLGDFPRLKAYYERHRPQIEGRHVARRGGAIWYRTIDRVNCELTNQPKLYIPDIKNSIHPVLDEGTTYPHHNLYFITSKEWDLEVLGALLLSDVGRFFVECYGVRMRGSYLRMQAQYLRRIRVPRPSDITGEMSRLLRQAFKRHDVEAASHLACFIYGIDDIPVDV